MGTHTWLPFLSGVELNVEYAQVPEPLDVTATQAELRAGLPDVAAAAEALSRALDERAGRPEPRSGAPGGPAAAGTLGAAPAGAADPSRTAGAAADGVPAPGRAAESLGPDPNHDPDPAEHVPACIADAGREELEVVFLGTGASIPSKYRNVTGIYVHRFAAARPVYPPKKIRELGPWQ